MAHYIEDSKNFHDYTWATLEIITHRGMEANICEAQTKLPDAEWEHAWFYKGARSRDSPGFVMIFSVGLLDKDHTIADVKLDIDRFFVVQQGFELGVK